jgi:sulfate adenylyltransferase large subunit
MSATTAGLAEHVRRSTSTTLRIATAGSVDDGKSTLIGRLLHDTKTVFEDQLAAVEKASRRYGDGEVNLALLTDGLRAEREQGITIDVAHRYFATPQRSFIVADTPGHAQYTRNMVTGASNADVAVVLVDARHGVVEQTRRHAFISTLLGVRAIVIAVNKMDLVDWDEWTFTAIADEVTRYVAALDAAVPVYAIPISALDGGNVVATTDRSPWYGGPALLEWLEGFDRIDDGWDEFSAIPNTLPRVAEVGARLAVQRVIRPQGGEHADFRGYAGRLTGGVLRVGDEVTVLPVGKRSTVTSILRHGRELQAAFPGHAVTVSLADDIDIARGDVVTAADSPVEAQVLEDVVVDACWMIDSPLQAGSRWWFKHGTRVGRATVTEVLHRHDLSTLDAVATDQLGLNDLGRVRLSLSEPIVADPYHVHHETGRLILIDEATNTTAAAAMICTG